MKERVTDNELNVMRKIKLELEIKLLKLEIARIEKGWQSFEDKYINKKQLVR